MDFELLEQLARDYIGQKKSHPRREEAAAFRHGKRLMRGVIALRQKVTPDGSMDEILRIAALFHDIEKGNEPHSKTGAAAADELLRGVIPDGVREQAVSLIARHDDRVDPDEWAKLFQDADVLDHIGCYEIWMSFVSCYATGRGMENALTDWYEPKFDAAMENLRRGLHYEASRAVFDEKVAFERQVRERLRREANGEYMM